MVIGIIGVLIAILVPALSKAQDAASRTRCLSNLRQLGFAFVSYATQNRDYVPLGYFSGQKQTNYLVHYNEGGVQFFSMIGLLFRAKLLDGASAIYCPAEPLARWQFATPENPWPPVETATSTQQNTRAGYGCRPTVNWLETGAWPDTLTRLNQMKNRAILADLAPTPYFVNRRHRSGINVFYANGSARWVDRKVFQSSIKNIPDISDSFDPGWNNSQLDESTSPPTGLWIQLDRP